MDNIVGRAKKHQQMLRSHGELSRQVQNDWDAEEGYRKDERINQLEVENRKIMEQLERSKGLARMTLLERDGLIDVIKHLKKSWTPPENEQHYKEKITPLVDEIVALAKNDPSKQANVEERMEFALKNTKKSSPGPK